LPERKREQRNTVPCNAISIDNVRLLCTLRPCQGGGGLAPLALGVILFGAAGGGL